MKETSLKHLRILAIAPSSRGVGFVVVEGPGTLVDWGVKSVKTDDKNAQSLANVVGLINHYQPGVLVLQDASTKTSRRSARIKTLSRKMVSLAKTRNVRVAMFSHEEVRATFFTDGLGTKHALAELIAKRFPEELGSRLPPKRRPWMSEVSRMSIFDAVGLALTWLDAPDQSKARHLKIH